MVTLKIATGERLIDSQQKVLQSFVDFARIFSRMGNCAKLDGLNRLLSQPISAA